MRAVLSSRPFVTVGLISYSLYLWHQPAFSFARLYSINELTQWHRLALIALSVALAYLTWMLVEQPFRRGDKISARATWRSAATASLAVIAFSGASIAAHGWPSRMPYQIPESGQAGYHNLKGGYCLKVFCTVGDDVAPAIAVVGDSHAAMLAQSLDTALRGTGRSAWILAKGDIYVSHYPEFWGRDYSIDDYNNILSQENKIIMDPEIRTVVLSARAVLRVTNELFDNGEGGVEKNPRQFNGRSADEKAGVEKVIRDGIVGLLSAGKRVVLVYPIPEVGWNTPNVLTKLFRKGKPPFTTSQARYEERSADVIELYDSIDDPNLVRVYPENIFCSIAIKDRCSVYDDGEVLYVDYQHLSVAGADRLAAAIVDAAKAKWGGL